MSYVAELGSQPAEVKDKMKSHVEGETKEWFVILYTCMCSRGCGLDRSIGAEVEELSFGRELAQVFHFTRSPGIKASCHYMRALIDINYSTI